MTHLKTVAKYILGQFLFFFKNVFYPDVIDIKTIKTLFITSSTSLTVYKRILRKKKDNFIYIVDNKSFGCFEIDYLKRKVSFDFIKFPETNADLLILDNSIIKKLPLLDKKPNYISFSLFVLIFNFPSILKFSFKRKYFFKSFKFWNGLDVVFEKRKKNHELSSRRYIPIELSRVSFLKALCEKKINNVVLRWFEEIEITKNPFEDIDILVDTNDVKDFDEFTFNKVGIFPLDVYSTTGELETSYANLPYFPLKLSEDILLNKVFYNNCFLVPNEDYYLISLVYHVLFHKSLDSGVGIDKYKKTSKKIKHNYANILKDLFENSSFSIGEITLNSLYKFLENCGYLPEYDLVLKLKKLKNDEWFGQVVKKAKMKYEADFSKVEGLSVYLLRNKAVSLFNIKMIEEYLNFYGFKIIKQDYIKGQNFNRVKQNIRGGKWDKGPFDINSGAPKYYYLVFDSFSKKPSGKYKYLYPNLENEKAIKVKLSLRDKINNQRQDTLNALHSSDDFYEAIFYMQQLGFDNPSINNLITDCVSYKKQYETSHKVLKNMSRFALRSKVELIKYNGNLAVKKTYRAEHLDFLNREIWLFKKLKGTYFVPKLLEESDNYIIIEYIDNALNLGNNEKIKLQPRNIIQLRDFFETLYGKNITILDANPSNFLIDSKGNIKVIDFEYAQSYKNKPNRIFDIYELKKIILKDVSVYPGGHEDIKNAYNKFWRYRVNLTKFQFFVIKNEFMLYRLININKYIFSFEKFVIVTSKRIFRMFRREYFRFYKEIKQTSKH